MSITLFSCPQMRELALAVAATRKNRVRYGAIEWKKFEDGFPNLMIRDVAGIVGEDVAFLACFDTPAEIFRQLAVIHALPRYGARSLTVLLPYFPTGTMERVNREGEIATAMTLARLLSATPLSSGRGPARIVIWDIHALAERFYFGDSVIPVLQSGMPLLRAQLKAFDASEKISVAFPDEGAYKRFGADLADFPQIICGKTRIGDQRIVKIREGRARLRHVVIVDDLVKTGGTLLECKKALDRAGAKHVSAYVTHAVFPKRSWENFLRAGFDRFWITDSCPKTAALLHEREPFEALSLANSIAEFIAPQKGN